MSIRPNFSTAPSTTASTSSRTVTSPRMKWPRSPALISFSARSPFSVSRPLMTTWAPSARKASPMPRPMPVLPLVMTATLPSSFPMLALLWLAILWLGQCLHRLQFLVNEILTLASGRLAAVHDQQRSGDEARLVREQETDRGGDLLRLRHPFLQVALAEHGRALLHAAGPGDHQRFGHAGPGAPRSHGVHPDLRRHVAGQLAGKGQDRALGRAVRRVT